MIQQLFESLPDVANAVARSLAKTDRIAVISTGGDASAGASRATRDVTNTVARFPRSLSLSRASTFWGRSRTCRGSSHPKTAVPSSWSREPGQPLMGRSRPLPRNDRRADGFSAGQGESLSGAISCSRDNTARWKRTLSPAAWGTHVLDPGSEPGEAGAPPPPWAPCRRPRPW